MSKQMEKSALGQKSSGVVLKEITKIFQQPDTGKDFRPCFRLAMSFPIFGD